MKRIIIFSLLLALTGSKTLAQEDTINISGNNTSDTYVSYNKEILLSAGKTVRVLMARYCYFSSTITGSGVLNLCAGGERCYLGTAKGASWPNWTGYTGDIHIWPYPENSSSAGFYGVVLAHGGKTSSPENALDDAASGKVNPSMANNRVTVHDGATICCEAHSSGSGFRIGELQMEPGSILQGYMKNSRAAYYLVGGLNTDATLAGLIRPSDYRDDTSLGLIKEGTGTYTITGNDNYVNGALRVLEGRVLVMNDRAAAESGKLRGALGARPNSDEAIAYVFEKGVLGGTGSIGGTVDNYGTVAPGADAIGTLTLKDYKNGKPANLYVRPASVLSFRVASTALYDQLDVNGTVKYYNIDQNFMTSDKMPLVQVVLDDNVSLQVGDEFEVLTAKDKASQAGDWHFDMKTPQRYTWAVDERVENGEYKVVLRVVSLENQGGGSDDPGGNHDEQGHMGAFYDDGIDDATDLTTLASYAAQNGKHIGIALCTYKGYQSDRDEAGRQFNMMVAENEMKMETLQPSQGQFNYGSADQLVNFAQQNGMVVRGHCLAWHSQMPTWVSSDGKKNDKNWTRDQALQILKNHINNVVGHFKGKVAEWDVVNECLDDDQSSVRTNPAAYDLRKESVWTKAIGEDFIDSAFVWAHRADPDAVLYLNDYGVELQGKAKTTAFYNLAVRLKNSNIPIHGVGLQCHFSIGDVDSVRLEQTIRRFADAGLKCIITELDMGVPSTSAENLEEQARNYRVITDIVLNNENCPNMLVWGIKDNDSWRSGSNPLLYTSGLGKKPAWYAVRSALRHRVLYPQSVDQLRREDNVTNAAVYDLMGRRVDGALKPGLYIRNGRKFVIK